MPNHHCRKNCNPPGRDPAGGFFVRAAPEQTVRLHPPVKVPITCTEPTPAGAARNPYEVCLTAQVIQLRDYQNPKDIERMRQALEREAAEIMSEVAPYGGAGIDGMELGKDQ